jgi:hypothetical protein
MCVTGRGLRYWLGAEMGVMGQETNWFLSHPEKKNVIHPVSLYVLHFLSSFLPLTFMQLALTILFLLSFTYLNIT